MYGTKIKISVKCVLVLLSPFLHFSVVVSNRFHFTPCYVNTALTEFSINNVQTSTQYQCRHVSFAVADHVLLLQLIMGSVCVFV